jgi:hypothetical protein
MCIAAVLAAITSGCLFYATGKVEEGKTIDAAKVKQIVIGMTTRGEVYELLGTPHSQFQGQVELKEGSLQGLFSHIQNRYLSSLDDEHYAMLYRFTTTRGKITAGTAIVLGYSNQQYTIQSDELLILFDKKTENRLTERVGSSNYTATYNALNQISTTTAPGGSRTNDGTRRIALWQ